MPCFLTFLILFVTGLWCLGVASGRGIRRAKERQALDQLASRFRGRLDARGWFLPQTVVLPYGEATARISNRTSREFAASHCLQIQISWSHHRLRCEICTRPAQPHQRGGARLGPAVDVGGDSLAAFDVYGTEQHEIRQLLTSGVRWQIERLAGLGLDRRLRILIRDGKMVIEKPWPRLWGDAPAQFVQAALEFYDQCVLATATGIQFLHTDEAQPLEQVICKVCGEEIQEQMVVCTRCKTPHHHDCWQYVGACSVFGCRETNYILPPTGPAL